MTDFTKAEIGQEVTCLMNGKGVITIIKSGSYPIIVDFGSFEEAYTAEGKLFYTLPPSLVVGHIDLPKIDQGKLPERLPDLKVDDLVWVWAFNKSDKLIRCFSHFTEKGHLHTFDSGYASHKEPKRTTWWENYEVYEK